MAWAQRDGQCPRHTKACTRKSQTTQYPEVRNSCSPGPQAVEDFGIDPIHPLESHPICEPWNGAAATGLIAHKPSTWSLFPAPWEWEQAFDHIPIPGACRSTLIQTLAPGPVLKLDPVLFSCAALSPHLSPSLSCSITVPAGHREAGINHGWLLR